MKNKNFKTIDEQMKILRERGLIITDEGKCKEFLLHNNYYRISGYSLTLRKNDKFYENATFQNIIDIYEFDRNLRNLLLKFLEIIEVKFKSIYVYELCKKYDSTSYLDSTFFIDEKIHVDIITKIEKQKKVSLDQEVYLRHFVSNLRQEVPFWASVDLFTIRDISILYKISNEAIKKSVAINYGLNMKKNDEILGKFMHSMTIIRNICAHGGRLYNRIFHQKPSLNKKETSLLRLLDDGTHDNSRLFSYILVMKRLLSEEDFQLLKDGIININRQYPFVSMDHYGFNENWEADL